MKELYDIHTHLLPGVDDGAKDWDSCLKMIEKSWNSGVRNIIATPHYLPWEKENTSGQIAKLCREAEQKAKTELGREMRIFPGQELYFHIELAEKLERGEILTLAGSRYVLVEFGTDTPFSALYHGINRICRAQYRPILAHVERYGCLRKGDRMEEAALAGALFQMNLEAFQGGFLDETSRWAKRQLLNRRIDFIASDMHNLSGRPPMDREKFVWTEKKLDKEYQKELLHSNAQQICQVFGR
ncbi:MAG: hypothetical protein KH921_09230 [Erysipelotrichaceae bacterium]|nr:hypothetical protein [Erysipelotrichaceae bacterium]